VKTDGRTDGQTYTRTQSQTQLIALSTHRLAPAWVIITNINMR